MNKMSCAAIAVMLMSTLPVFGQQTAEDLEKEIARIRKELVQVQNERASVKSQAKSDREEFDSYRQTVLSKMRVLRAETDSIAALQAGFKQKNASLSGTYMNLVNGQKQYDMLHEQFRTKLLAAIGTVESRTVKLTPSAKEKPMAAVSLLRSELSTKSVDNIEAVGRLFQIVRDMDASGSSVQIVQGTSPVADVRGTTYRLRLGTLYEAVVNENGDKAAVWKGVNEKGVDQWDVQSAEQAKEILAAVKIREGKALPRLVKIPFRDIPVTAEGAQL